MIGQAVRVVAYRFRATFRQRRGGYLALVLLISLVGGLAMGAVAAGRRTQSSYAVYLASTNPSDFGVGTGVLNPQAGVYTGYDPGFVQAIAHLPHVQRVVTAAGIDVIPLGRNGAPVNDPAFPPAAGNGLGSVNGEGLSVDRLSVTDGRLPDPHRAGEIVMTADSAAALHLRVGGHLLLGLYTNVQTLEPAFGSAAVAPYRRLDATLVGIVVPGTGILADDVDSQSSSLAYFAPALTRQLLGCCVNYSESAITVAGGARNYTAVENEISRAFPPGAPLVITPTITDNIAKADRSLRPEAIALTVFGGIAALAAFVIAAQIIGRAVRIGTQETMTLRALGANKITTAGDALGGLLVAVITGALLAGVVAIALSPLSPLGPVRSVYPSPGVAFDWTVLGIGVAVLIVGLSAIACLFAYRWSPHRTARRALRPEPTSNVVRLATASGMPVSAVAGIRFALDPGAGNEAVPMRSAIVGAALALVVLIGTITFGASLDSLVSTPRLFGWNWDYALGSGGNIPAGQAATLLGGDRNVGAWSGYYFGLLHVDGQLVPVMGGRPGAPVQPPLLSGHGLRTSGEVVLGPVTLADLHKRVGDTVTVNDGARPDTRLRIIGTATMPTLGNGGLKHLEMGSGALLPYTVIPATQLNLFANPMTGPDTIFVDLKQRVDGASARRSLDRIAAQLSNNFNFGVAVVHVVHPAEIVNYRSLGTTPAILGTTLAAGAVAGLALTLVASVRRRRRDVALLKTLGFTTGQLARTVAWQSSVAVAAGAMAGIPLGIVLGRVSWDLFAREIHAVPAPTVPAVATILIGIGALVAANVVAAVPGRIAARTPTAVLLRAE